MANHRRPENKSVRSSQNVSKGGTCHFTNVHLGKPRSAITLFNPLRVLRSCGGMPIWSRLFTNAIFFSLKYVMLYFLWFLYDFSNRQCVRATQHCWCVTTGWIYWLRFPTYIAGKDLLECNSNGAHVDTIPLVSVYRKSHGNWFILHWWLLLLLLIVYNQWFLEYFISKSMQIYYEVPTFVVSKVYGTSSNGSLFREYALSSLFGCQLFSSELKKICKFIILKPITWWDDVTKFAVLKWSLD